MYVCVCLTGGVSEVWTGVPGTHLGCSLWSQLIPPGGPRRDRGFEMEGEGGWEGVRNVFGVRGGGKGFLRKHTYTLHETLQIFKDRLFRST